jgi:hypothetical protein
VIFLSEKLSGKIAISAEGLSIEELKSIIETAEQLYANLQNNILPHVQKLLLE